MVPRRSVDDLHERELDGLFVFEEADMADARVAQHAVVEAAILLPAESRGAATDSGDLDGLQVRMFIEFPSNCFCSWRAAAWKQES